VGLVAEFAVGEPVIIELVEMSNHRSMTRNLLNDKRLTLGIPHQMQNDELLLA